MTMSRQEFVRSRRQAIRTKLEEIVEILIQDEQTTHGRLGGFTISHIAEDLATYYHNPTAYTGSNLVQAIQGFLKTPVDADLVSTQPAKPAPFNLAIQGSGMTAEEAWADYHRLLKKHGPNPKAESNG